MRTNPGIRPPNKGITFDADDASDESELDPGANESQRCAKKMTRWKTIALIAMLLLIASKLSYDYGARQAVERIGLIEYHFRVVDAESGESIPGYSFTFPNTQFLSDGDKAAFPRYSTQRQGEEFSIFYSIADRPMEITIGADGFIDQSITLNCDSGYSSGGGPLPLGMATIQLKKEAQQVAAPNP